MRRIDDETTAPYGAWAKMGSPPYPTRAQLAALHVASQMSEEWLDLDLDLEDEGALVEGAVPAARLFLEVPPYGVVHLTIGDA